MPIPYRHILLSFTDDFLHPVQMYVPVPRPHHFSLPMLTGQSRIRKLISLHLFVSPVIRLLVEFFSHFHFSQDSIRRRQRDNRLYPQQLNMNSRLDWLK